jgi:DNA-binding MarR family transcriptional regulator/predicted GNAT family N-acyltransferase
MLPEQVDLVRRFNRAVSQRLGTLSDSFLELGRPYGEARLLFEIGHEGGREGRGTGVEVRDLRSRLELDSGYVSRLIRALERQGLIVSKPGKHDRRVRRLTLTKAGRKAYADIDRVGDAFAHRVLTPLSTRERGRLVEAMAEVERLMRAFAVTIQPEPAASGDAQASLAAYYGEIAERFDASFDPAKGLPTGVEDMTPPRGLFLMARLDGRPVGCGALLVEPEGVGHIRRMWVAGEVRGLGVGRRLLAALEDAARGFGLDTVRLETNRVLAEAQALYRASGYQEVAPFNRETYAHHWFEKRDIRSKPQHKA